MTNPTQLVRDLDADAIRVRLSEIDSERRALLVLLRAARRAHPKTPNLPATVTSPTKPHTRKGVRS